VIIPISSSIEASYLLVRPKYQNPKLLANLCFIK
jgi:hypothetical protein